MEFFIDIYSDAFSRFASLNASELNVYFFKNFSPFLI